MTTTIIALGIILVLGGSAAIIFSLNTFGTDELAPRLETFVSSQDDKSRRYSGMFAVRTRELSGSLTTRVLIPIFRGIGSFFNQFTPGRSYERLQRKLYIAANPYGMGVREFYGLQIICLTLGLLIGYLVLRRAQGPLWLLLAGLITFFLVFFPNLWLSSMVERRQGNIRRGLPDALDMLSVCAEAGLGFDQSLQRVSEHWRTPIALEFGRVVNEIEMGISRQDALRNLADRFDVTELSSFIAIVLQSDKLGMSIADTLHSQAEQMRVERRFRAQEQARTIPVKMLLPLTFFIFPALLVVLLAPSLPQLIGLFGGF